ncbi:SDR family NAD(P)-dependent oxidoreductase [Luteimonas terrae]|uniref:SDR family NAD(P)-dependent oxidoreductase n=1 Tax=Luteimonas terrae TaxID=1530191 RepID=A0A4R5UCK2_9GAMM|nr:SDR family NAD(P)-dependent oxidoreductase [Luteimonas terrae]
MQPKRYSTAASHRKHRMTFDIRRRRLLRAGTLAALATTLPAFARTSTFDARTTAEQATAGLDLRGRTVVVTGATSGIGMETMRVLALRGAHVIGTARSRASGDAACAAVKGRATPVVLDLADFDSGRRERRDPRARRADRCAGLQRGRRARRSGAGPRHREDLRGESSRSLPAGAPPARSRDRRATGTRGRARQRRRTQRAARRDPVRRSVGSQLGGALRARQTRQRPVLARTRAPSPGHARDVQLRHARPHAQQHPAPHRQPVSRRCAHRAAGRRNAILACRVTGRLRSKRPVLARFRTCRAKRATARRGDGKAPAGRLRNAGARLVVTQLASMSPSARIRRRARLSGRCSGAW